MSNSKPIRKLNVVLYGEHHSGKSAFVLTAIKHKNGDASRLPAIGVSTKLIRHLESSSDSFPFRFIDTAGRVLDMGDDSTAAIPEVERKYVERVLGGLRVGTDLQHEHKADGTGWGDSQAVDTSFRADVLIFVVQGQWFVGATYEEKKEPTFFGLFSKTVKVPTATVSKSGVMKQYEFLQRVCLPMLGSEPIVVVSHMDKLQAMLREHKVASWGDPNNVEAVADKFKEELGEAIPPNLTHCVTNIKDFSRSIDTFSKAQFGMLFGILDSSWNEARRMMEENQANQLRRAVDASDNSISNINSSNSRLNMTSRSSSSGNSSAMSLSSAGFGAGASGNDDDHDEWNRPSSRTPYTPSPPTGSTFARPPSQQGTNLTELTSLLLEQERRRDEQDRRREEQARLDRERQDQRQLEQARLDRERQDQQTRNMYFFVAIMAVIVLLFLPRG
uniref:Predicted protein n=1 Tax=Hordeum vulgare subsp. vulgare TaxID=112509 RepID=F2DF78_HORVV|nr:predicted protein [Hordeum vulgare subsp. vulgare]